MGPVTNSARDEYETLSTGASLQILLPRKHDLDLKAVLEKSQDDLTGVPTRRHLFFDESATVYLVLKTTAADTIDLEQLLPSLEVTLSSHATDAVPHGGGNAASASGKHDLTTRSFSGSIDSSIVTLEDETYLIWKPTLHLPWPRVRLQRPAIYFTASVTLDPQAASKTPKAPTTTYLKSYEPLPANVLEPLQFEPSLVGSDVYLSEERITKIAPNASQTEERVRPVRGATKRAFPTVPALFTRLRYNRLLENALVSLHLETGQVIAGTVSIKDVVLEAPGFCLRELTSLTLPSMTQPGDEVVAIFQAEPVRGGNPNPISSTKISAHVRASADLDQGSHVDLDIHWHNQADLSPAKTHPEYAWSRPLSGVANGPTTQGFARSSSDSTMKTLRDSAGMTFSFTGPPTTHRGETFSLRVKCINHSTRSRSFVLTMPPNAKQVKRAVRQLGGKDRADVVAGIFKAPELHRARPPGVLPLDAEVRIGPLATGACYETDLTLRAMVTGVLDLGVLRIFDVDTRRTAEVTELPDVVALELLDAGGLQVAS